MAAMSLWVSRGAALALAVLAGCSIVLDRDAKQCETNADCDHFASHPVCQSGVCVSSGLGPPGCFVGEPEAQADFANQCTTAQTFQFDNCAALGLCDEQALTLAFDAVKPPQSQGDAPPPVGSQAEPTVKCADASPNVIYVTGSTNLPPLLKAVQPLLYARHEPGVAPWVIVFAPQTSCKGAAAIYDPTQQLITNTVNNYAFYYAPSGAQTFCRLADAGNVVDVGESDVYPSSCRFDPRVDVADYPGPIQAITFALPPSAEGLRSIRTPGRSRYSQRKSARGRLLFRLVVSKETSRASNSASESRVLNRGCAPGGSSSGWRGARARSPLREAGRPGFRSRTGSPAWTGAWRSAGPAGPSRSG